MVKQVSDYKERMVQEYHELSVRHRKLHIMLVKLDAGTLEFTPTCPVDVLKEQEDVMAKYLRILEVRAEIENVDLNGVRDNSPVDVTNVSSLPRCEDR